MLEYNAIGTYVLVLTLGTLLVAVLLIGQRRSGKAIAVWFMSALIGVLLGAAASAAIMQLRGYTLVKAFILPDGVEAAADDGGSSSTPEAPPEPTSSGAPSGAEAGGGPGGGGPGGGGRGNSPKRQLTTLVRKMHLLTGDIQIQLTGDQAARCAEILSRCEALAEMSDEQATALHDELLSVLDEQQQEKQAAIGLPRPVGPGGPGGGGGAPSPTANPFAQQQEGETLQSLLARLAGAASTAAAEGAAP